MILNTIIRRKMEKRTTLNIVVHVNDETIINAGRVPSADTDFVSLKVGPDVSVLLFTPEQARSLADAAVTAFALLKTIESEKEINSIWGDGTVEESEYNAWLQDGDTDEDDYDYPEYSCTDGHPCNLCVEYGTEKGIDDHYYDYENEPF
jgi:hypothetical protein